MRKPDAQFVRAIGRWDLAALMVNITLGSGILGLPAKLFALTNAYSVAVLLVCAALIGIIATCFAEVGSRFTNTGGPYLITRAALGPATGFIVGWLYWVSRVLTFATICNLLVVYSARFVPALQSGVGRTLLVSAVVLAITAINLLGICHATIASNALTTLKIAFLVLFGGAGLLSAAAWPDIQAVPPAAGDFSSAMLLGIFAFVGFEAALVSAGETREPRHDVPIAIAASLVSILLLYAGVQIVCIATVPALATSSAPLADAAIALWGPLGEQIVAAGAIVIMLGSLNSGFLATSRLPFAFAENADAPAALARVHPTFRTPHVAILVSAALVLIATLASSFLSAITLATSTRMVMYSAGCIALIALRRRPNTPPAGFNAPFGYALAVIASILSLALLASASARELTQLAIAAVLGIAIYAARAPMRRRLSRTPQTAGATTPPAGRSDPAADPSD